MKIFNIELIPDWKEAHKFLSVRLATLLLILSTAYDFIPMMGQYLPEGWVKYAAGAIILARIVQQARSAKKE